MGNITKLNDIICYNINAIDNLLVGLGGDLKLWDDNDFCVPTPTPTPTATPTPTPTAGGATPTPTPTCASDCCPASLCFSRDDCRNSCSCNDIRSVYLKRICVDDPCLLAFASGIFDDDNCSTAAQNGFYSDGTDCYQWNGTTLVYIGRC